MSIVIYILMGWLVVVALKPRMARLPLRTDLWLPAGGLFYTSGVVFDGLHKRARHSHGIWHLLR